MAVIQPEEVPAVVVAEGEITKKNDEKNPSLTSVNILRKRFE